MAELTLRLTGRPKIERDSSGLRKITRTYIVQGSSVTQEKIEEEVFLPYGTPDEEYNETITQDLTNGGLTDSEVTGAYLVQQEVAPGNSMSEATLVRVYQELDANSEPVKVGSDKIVRGENDRLTIAKTFIVKNPYEDQYAQNRIGVESLTLQGSECFLGSVQSEVNEVFTQFTETYYEDGILSESVSYRYGQYPNHKLEVRTVRSVAVPQPPPETEGPGDGPWVQVESKEGPGNRDYGQSGKTIKTIVFAKGEGLIKSSSQVKGKEPNTVEVLTIQYLTGEDGEVPDEEIPNFTRRTLQSVDEKEGYEIHTIGGVVLSSGSGVVDAKVEYKYGKKPAHKLEVANVVSYGVPAVSQAIIDFVYPDGDTTNLGDYVLVSEREDTKDEIDVYTSVYARGLGTISTDSRKVGLTTVSQITSLHPSSPSLPTAISGNELKREVTQLDGYQKLVISETTDLSGIVDRREELKNNGKLKLETITQIGSNWLESNTPEGYALVSDRSHTYDSYPAITRVYAFGDGEISSAVRQVGLTQVTESVSLHNATAELSTDLGENELKKEVREDSGYKILSVSTTSDLSGIVDQKLELRNNEKLKLKTITQIGSSWGSGSTPAGYVLISERSHTYDTYPAITRVYALGVGEISNSVKTVGLTKVSETTTLSKSKPENPTDALDFNIRSENGYYVLTESYVTSKTKIVEIKEEERFGSTLVYKTITVLGDTFDQGLVPSGFVEISSRKHTYQSFPANTKTFVAGQGTIMTRESENKYFTKNQTTYLNVGNKLSINSIVPEDAVEIVTSKKDGYTSIDYATLEAHDLKSSGSSWSNGYELKKFTTLNEELRDPPLDFTLVSKEVDPIDSKNFLNNYSYIKYGEFKNVSSRFQFGLQKDIVEEFVADAPDLEDVSLTKVTQIGDSLYRVLSETITDTSFKDSSKAYQNGLIISRRKEILSEVQDDEFAEQQQYQQIDHGKFLQDISFAEIDHDFKDYRESFGKFKNTKQETKILHRGDIDTPDEETESITSLSISRQSDRYVRATTTIETPSNFSEVKYSTIASGGVLVKETSKLVNPKDGTTLDESAYKSGKINTLVSQNYVDDNLGTIETKTEYLKGNWAAKSYKAARALTIETEESIVSANTIREALDSVEENQANNSRGESEFNYQVTQIAPGIFKKTETIVSREQSTTNLREEARYVTGGTLHTASRIGSMPDPKGVLVSTSETYEIIDGIAVTVFNSTSFEEKPTTITYGGLRPLGYPSVVGIDANGVFTTPGYSTYISATATVKQTSTPPSGSSSAYSPPSARVSYTAVPAAVGVGAIQSSQAFRNAVLDDASSSFSAQKIMFRGVYCKDVNSTCTGLTESSFKGQLSGKVLSETTNVVATYGPVKIYETTTWRAN